MSEMFYKVKLAKKSLVTSYHLHVSVLDLAGLQFINTFLRRKTLLGSLSGGFLSFPSPFLPSSFAESIILRQGKSYNTESATLMGSLIFILSCNQRIN